jgi:hypothetical protein
MRIDSEVCSAGSVIGLSVLRFAFLLTSELASLYRSAVHWRGDLILRRIRLADYSPVIEI